MAAAFSLVASVLAGNSVTVSYLRSLVGPLTLEVVMGDRGPIGKRSVAKAGHRTKAEMDAVESLPVVGPLVEVPAPDPAWHEVAQDWYLSLAESGQARFMEPSDWAGARYVAHAMSKSLAGKFSAVLFSGVWSAMNDLLTTEGSRRRVKLEVERRQPGAGDADVANLDDYRSISG